MPNCRLFDANSPEKKPNRPRRVLFMYLLAVTVGLVEPGPTTADVTMESPAPSVVRDTIPGQSPHVQDSAGGPVSTPDATVPAVIPPEPLPGSRPQPLFPALAAIASQSGRVEVEVFVDETGEVKSSKILSENPAALGFGEEVRSILPKWKFTPAIQDGKSISVWTSLIFTFEYGVGRVRTNDHDADQVAIEQTSQQVADTTVEWIPASDANVPFEVPPQPLPDFCPQPGYPQTAKATPKSGRVVIDIYINDRGEIRKWKIVQEEPAGMGFGYEVLKVIPGWKFTPAMQRGKPSGAWIRIPFNFRHRK